MGNSNSEPEDRVFYETPIRNDLEYRVYNNSSANYHFEYDQDQIERQRKEAYQQALADRKTQDKHELAKTLRETKRRIEQTLKDKQRMEDWEEKEELKKVSKLFLDDLDVINAEKRNEQRHHKTQRYHPKFEEEEQNLPSLNAYRPNSIVKKKG
jgi:hypothetical protein